MEGGLCSEGGEGARVVGIEATSRRTTTAAATEIAPRVSTTTTASSTITTSAATSATASTATAATVVGVGRRIVLAVENDNILLLGLLFLAGLGAGAGEVVLLLGVARELSALGLLLGALVGLSRLERAAESKTLLGLLGKVLVVGLGLLLGLGGGSVFADGGTSIGAPAICGLLLSFSLGNGFASGLVGPFGLSVGSVTPSVSGLLLLVAVTTISS